MKPHLLFLALAAYAVSLEGAVKLSAEAIDIDVAPANADRRAQLMWSGTARNSSDRSGWGRLTLVP